jgi:hypothetical protein
MPAPADVRAILDKYVFTFIENDIGRELHWANEWRKRKRKGLPARSFEGAGNVLAALGLLCYTEFIGEFITGTKGVGSSERNFRAAFCELGPDYRAFAQSVDVYDVYRNGMAHEYATKQWCRVVMFSPARKPVSGVGLKRGRLYFAVDAYARDLLALSRRIYASSPTIMPVPTKGFGEERRRPGVEGRLASVSDSALPVIERAVERGIRA